MPKLWKLKPIHSESVLMIDGEHEDYPFCLVHIDTFYQGFDDGIWAMLQAGETVKVEVDFRVIPEGS